MGNADLHSDDACEFNCKSGRCNEIRAEAYFERFLYIFNLIILKFEFRNLNFVHYFSLVL